MNWKLFLADIVLAVHLGVAGFLVLGLIMIWIGALLKWAWVRRRGFRLAHIVCMAMVVAETLAGVACPLTVLEEWLRGVQMWGDDPQQFFLRRVARDLLFHDLPDLAFAAAYVLFFGLILLSWRRVPPFPRKKQNR